MRLFICLLIACAVLCGCPTWNWKQKNASEDDQCTTSGVSPGMVVVEYLRVLRTSKGDDDRMKVTSFCTGEMLKKWKKVSPALYKKKYLDPSLKISKFSILNSGEHDKTHKWYRYQIVIQKSWPKLGDSSPQTYERDAEIVKINDRWFIESIHLVKSKEAAVTEGRYY
jgi:hypothetical protein